MHNEISGSIMQTVSIYLAHFERGPATAALGSSSGAAVVGEILGSMFGNL